MTELIRLTRQLAHSRRLPMRVDTLLALLCLYWALALHRPVLAVAHDSLGVAQLPLLVLLIALLHFVMLAPFTQRAWARPMLLLLSGVAAVCSHFTSQLGTAFDPAMLRNVMATDWAEARELLVPSLPWHALLAFAPAALLISQVELLPAPQGKGRWRGLAGAAGRWLLAVLALAGLLLLMYQPLSSLTREHRALRYQLLPAAPLWSMPRALKSAAPTAQAREPIGLDAKPGPSWAQAERPRLLVLVVGETVRAANWGRHQAVDGSWRDTAPLSGAEPGLLRWPVVNTCGSDTETSLPCMFAPGGRHDHDAERFARQQSLLHVLERAGVKTEWLDNQSGCKGVCDGLQAQTLQCDGGRCLDDALFDAVAPRLQQLAQQKSGSPNSVQVLVLHMLGNHGPAYHRRVPAGSQAYEPACQQDDLGRCSRAEIVNAYDNALRHTDALLARLWQQLRAAQGEVDSAMLFIPDHGESLGENGLYLHGMPYAIAPKEQTQVPMLLGISPAWAAARGWSAECLAKLPQQPTTHDHLFGTLLTLLDVQTQLHERRWDLFSACA